MVSHGERYKNDVTALMNVCASMPWLRTVNSLTSLEICSRSTGSALAMWRYRRGKGSQKRSHTIAAVREGLVESGSGIASHLRR